MSRGRTPDTVLRARWVVPLCGPPIGDGWVRIRRGRIVAVGGGQPPGLPGSVVDASGAVVMPGLVNAHTHLEFSDLRRPLDLSGGLDGWIVRVVERRRQAAATAGAVASAIRQGILESAAAGVTAIGEIGTCIPPGGYPDRGPRLRVYREALGLGSGAAAAGRSAAGDVARLRAAGVAAGLSPHAPYSVAGVLGRDVVEMARRLGLPVAMHVAETEAEAELLRSRSGPLRLLLERLGAWGPDAGPSLLSTADWITRLARAGRGAVVHGTHLGLDEDAVARLARHRGRLCVVVCPRTTLAMSGVLPPVRLLRDAGVRVATGTDSRASNPDLSVLAECRTLWEAGLASPAEAVRMATVDAAWALGFERVSGILAPGRPADLAILETPGRHRDPFEAILDPDARVTATLRGGRTIAGRPPG